MKLDGITEKAQNAILYDEEYRCKTPDECLEYLQDGSNFKNISKQIIESIEEKTRVSRSKDETIEYLTEKLLEIQRTDMTFIKEEMQWKEFVASFLNKGSVIADADLIEFFKKKKIKLTKKAAKQIVESIVKYPTLDAKIEYLTNRIMEIIVGQKKHDLHVTVASWINGTPKITVNDLTEYCKTVNIQLNDYVQLASSPKTIIDDNGKQHINTPTNDEIVNIVIKMILEEGQCEDVSNSDRNKFRDSIYEWKKATQGDSWRTFNQLTDRNLAIKICFALEFDLEQSNEFLRKACGLHPLSARCVEEAICMNCLQYGKSYSNFQKILLQYDSSNNQSISQENVLQSGDTTKKLAETALINYESDEDLLIKFLLPNKEKFIGYSKTVQEQYFVLKRKLIQSYIGRVLFDEYAQDSTQIQDELSSPEYGKQISEFVGKYKAFSELLPVYQSCIQKKEYSRFWDYLRKVVQEHALLQEIIDELQNHDRKTNTQNHDRKINAYIGKSFLDFNSNNNSSLNETENQSIVNQILNLYPLPIYDKIKNMTNDCTDISDRDKLIELLKQELNSSSIEDEDIDKVFGPIITFRQLITNVLLDRSLKPKWTKDKKYNRYYISSESTIKKVTDNFVTIKNIGDLERNPSKYSFSAATRKIIVMLFYLNYIYDWDEQNEEKGIYDFFWELDELLESCNLAPIYLADQFDWLVFKSIRNYELTILSGEDIEDAISFLQEVIAISFPYED